MRGALRRRCTALGLLLLALASAGLVAVPPAQAAVNRIAGVVTVGGVAVPGVELELMRWTGSEWSYGVGADEDGFSDSSGAYTFSDLAPGTYSLTVHRRYPHGGTTLPAGPGAPGAITIDADDQATLDMVLPAAAQTVAGQVLELDGTPAAGARVELGQWSAEDHPGLLFSTVADGEGRYALPLYDDVRHTVTAWTPGYLRTLLGDVTLYWEATHFGIGGGGALAPLTLQSQHVAGVVRTVSGAAAPGRTVTLRRWNHAADVWVDVASTVTTASGRYVFRNTGEGHYTVRVAHPFGPVHPTTGLDEPFVTGFASDQGDGPGYRWVAGSEQSTGFDLALPPPVAGAVRVRGTTEVGRSVRALVDSWAASYQLHYQWLRDGRPIPGATAPTHRLVAADGRRRISVRVTATTTFPGLTAQQVVAPAVRVRARSLLTVSARAARRSVRLVVRLRLPGTTVARTTSAVSVYVDGRRRAVVRLRNGEARLTLRGVTAGQRRVEVRFAGSADYTAERVVRVVRVR